MSYEGGCHCGAVRFRVEAPVPEKALACNCSYCSARGLLLSFAPKEAFTLLQGEESLADYRFNTRRIEHRFCTACGVQPFSFGAAPDGTINAAINLRCVPAVDLGGLTLKHYDGASH